MPKRTVKKQKLSDLKFTIEGPPKSPVWKGPEEDGISQSMISRYVSCKERFRLYAMFGLKAIPKFHPKMEFGHMWHLCEELHADGQPWEEQLSIYAKNLAKKFREDSKEISKWYRICKLQFPIYQDFWKDEEDEKVRTPTFQELAFRVPYKLPSGRKVYMRGKFDGCDHIGPVGVDPAGHYLNEHKTKGTVNEFAIANQMQFDLQSNFYTVALQMLREYEGEKLIPKGIRYNVVKRPLSGGKGSIRRHKARGKKKEETLEHFYGRLEVIIRENPHDFFMRLKVVLSKKDINKFKDTFLTPLLEEICDNYEWWAYCMEKGLDPFRVNERRKQFPKHSTYHWRYPYGPWNTTFMGMRHDLDDYIDQGSLVGLKFGQPLFTELVEEDMSRNAK